MDANDGKFKIGCKCGGRFRVPVSAAGKRMKCPKCAAAIKIPIPKSAVAAKQPDVSPSTLGDGDDLLGAMADVESSAASVMPTVPDPGNPCPSCAAPVTPGAMMCTQCGHSMTGGSRPAGAKKSAGASAAAKSLGKAGAAAAVAAAAGAGRFGIGVGFSAAGAILGGVIWYAIAMSSGYEIGYVAILVGLLAGGGMLMGAHGDNALGGLVAAVFAVGAIFGTKYMIFSQFVDEFVRNDMAYALSETMTMAKLKADGIEDIDENIDTYSTVAGDMYMQVESLSRAELESRLSEHPETYDTIRDTQPTAESALRAEYSFSSFLDFKDILWCIFAIGGAWRVSAGVSDD